VDLAVTAATFGLVFVAELPDKTFLAALLLGTRMSPLLVWAGAAGALVVQAAISVLAGGLVVLAPRRAVEVVVAVAFAAGGAWALATSRRGEEDSESEAGRQIDRATAASRGAWRTLGTAFGLIFLAEWGDLTQFVTAELSARTAEPLSVFIGAALALVCASGLAVGAGSVIERLVPARVARRVVGVVLLGLALVSGFQALRG
jgi:putative Ca2+/H+ antiporter (TMEM165/GDT1 family)